MFDQWVSLLPERSIQRKVRKIYCRQIDQARSKVKTEKKKNKNKKYSRHIGNNCSLYLRSTFCVFFPFEYVEIYNKPLSLYLWFLEAQRRRGGPPQQRYAPGRNASKNLAEFFT